MTNGIVRLTLALATAIVAGSLAGGLTFFIGMLFDPNTVDGASTPNAGEAVAIVLFLSMFVGMFLAPAAATLGLIWHAVGMRKGLVSRAHYVLAGAVIGAAFNIILTTLTMGAALSPIYLLIVNALGGLVAGAMTGLVGWTIRRPDRG